MIKRKINVGLGQDKSRPIKKIGHGQFGPIFNDTKSTPRICKIAETHRSIRMDPGAKKSKKVWTLSLEALKGDHRVTGT